MADNRSPCAGTPTLGSTQPRLTPVARAGRPSVAPAQAARRTAFSHSYASVPSCSMTSSVSFQSARIAPAPANLPTSARLPTAPLTTAERGRGICGSVLRSSNLGPLHWWTSQAERRGKFWPRASSSLKSSEHINLNQSLALLLLKLCPVVRRFATGTVGVARKTLSRVKE